MKIYTDQPQCELFNAPYFGGEGEMLVCSADALLRSKGGDGYDKVHREYLEPLGSKTLILQRTEDCGPGWWEVIKTL
jgi:hypothetical protein